MLSEHPWDDAICTETELAVRILSDVPSPLISFPDPYSPSSVLHLVHFAETAAALEWKSDLFVRSDLFSWVKLGFQRLQSTIKYFLLLLT